MLSGLALLVIGTGSGIAMAPTTSMIMAAVPLNRAGMGSAVNDTAREVGGAVGIAVLGSVLALRYRSGLGSLVDRLPEPVAELVDRGLGQALVVADELGGPEGAAIGSAARGSFIDAMGVTLRVGALTALVTAGLVLWMMRAEAGTATDGDRSAGSDALAGASGPPATPVSALD